MSSTGSEESAIRALNAVAESAATCVPLAMKAMSATTLKAEKLKSVEAHAAQAQALTAAALWAIASTVLVWASESIGAQWEAQWEGEKKK